LSEFLEWALEDLNRNNDKEIETRTKVYEAQHKTLADTQKQLDKLTKMRYR
jgi:oligoendopeptidase F